MTRPKPTEAAPGLVLTRRTALGTFAAWASLLATDVLAQNESALEVFLRQQAIREAQETFDGGAQSTPTALKSDVPLLSAETAASLERAIADYQGLVSRGGWPKVPAGAKLRIGAKIDAVATLRHRLTVTGDLAPQRYGYSDVFDSYVDAAVKRAQVRHGLNPTGIADKALFDVLNVPADYRLRQLETNLVRVRTMTGFLGDRYLFVNIPAAELEAIEGGRVVARHQAVVGKVDRQTPILTAKVQEINFNPYWHAPISIIQKDLIPKMREDPKYLTKNKIRIFDGKGQEVAPESVDWTRVTATQYAFRQDNEAEVNAMGTVKINFPNPHNVYMHDTPFKNIFGFDFRFHSSGCMRIQNTRELVTWLLRDTANWDRGAIDEVIRNGGRVDAKLKAPVPVYTNYVTAWATPGGVTHFRDDIYGRDGNEIAQLAPTGTY